MKNIKENNILINNSNSNINNYSDIGIPKLKQIKGSLIDDKEKDFCEMETPTLLNTPKLTKRILDAKLNLFEKIKNINTNCNSNKKSNNNNINKKEI